MAMIYKPQEEYHKYLPLRKLITKIKRHQHSVFRCRAIGVFSAQGTMCRLHDLDDHSKEICVSLRYMKSGLPFMGRPFTVELIGFVHWHGGVGPVMYAYIIKELAPPLAERLARTMKWIVDHHSIKKPACLHV